MDVVKSLGSEQSPVCSKCAVCSDLPTLVPTLVPLPGLLQVASCILTRESCNTFNGLQTPRFRPRVRLQGQVQAQLLRTGCDYSVALRLHGQAQLLVVTTAWPSAVSYLMAVFSLPPGDEKDAS